MTQQTFGFHETGENGANPMRETSSGQAFGDNPRLQAGGGVDRQTIHPMTVAERARRALWDYYERSRTETSPQNIFAERGLL